MKDASAWIAQKLGRTKLSTNDPFGLFEAIELMTLGVAGKIALWKALQAVPGFAGTLGVDDLNTLIVRAEKQFEQLEESRLRIVRKVF